MNSSQLNPATYVVDIVKGWPPNIVEITESFNLPKGVIFTYGNTIYNPSGDQLSQALLEHEFVHVRQQADKPEAWWGKYLDDPEWRLEQELEAHRAEWKTFYRSTFSREKRAQYLWGISCRLAGPMYGGLLTIKEARERIKQK